MESIVPSQIALHQAAIEQIYKAICKAHEMFDKAEALCQSFAPIGRNGQQLLNFIEEVKDYE